MTDQLNVSERARKAAWPLRSDFIDDGARDRVGWLGGAYDHTKTIQAFARFEQPLLDRVRELEGALEPFADKAAQFSKQGDGTVTIQMDFAHFRRALATLRSTTDAADTPPASAVERAAQAIYEHWAFDDRAPNPKPKWVPGGNSEKQDIARRLARAALTTAPTAPVDREAVISAIEAKIGGAFHGATGRAVATEVYDAIVSLLPKIPEGGE